MFKTFSETFLESDALLFQREKKCIFFIQFRPHLYFSRLLEGKDIKIRTLGHKKNIARAVKDLLSHSSFWRDEDFAIDQIDLSNTRPAINQNQMFGSLLVELLIWTSYKTFCKMGVKSVHKNFSSVSAVYRGEGKVL